jgi:hypothetical protein
MVLYRQIKWSIDHGPLYLSIQHHGLFSPIPYMRPGTTLSVYTTPWSLLTNPIHETSDHSICLYNIMVLYRQIKWSMISYMELVRRDHGVVYTDRVPTGLVHDTDEKRPCWSHALNSWSLLTNHIHENRGHSICL